MKLRYKHSGTECGGSYFNMLALAEVDVGDDSASISGLDVFIERTQKWKDMCQAFKDRDIICDNYNTCFFEPKNDEDRKRGYTLY